MKLFGKDLFGFKNDPELMYDFAQHGILNSPDYGYFSVQGDSGSAATSSASTVHIIGPKPIPTSAKTPKEIFDAQALHDMKFAIKRDEDYIAEQVKEIDEKLGLLGKPKKKSKNDDRFSLSLETGGVMFGREELQSIRTRLLNRRKIDSFKKIIDKYPHTTSSLVARVVEDNSNLSCQKATEFVPDMPKEAIAAMKEYNQMCLDLCNQKAVFYVIADKKDFQKKNERRDPILLAQSPFGFFWQILGAWDKEMIYLGDL